MGGRDHSIECETCGIYRGGINDLQCDCDGSYILSLGRHLIWERLDLLASNLAIGAALCRAFRLGFDEAWNRTGEGFNSEYTSPRFKWPDDYEWMAKFADGDDQWRPGCGRPAPGETP